MSVLDSEIWNKKIVVPRLTLERRDSRHADFLINLWHDTDFLNHYNRLLAYESDVDKLSAQLQRERHRPIQESRSCHWTIIKEAQPVGIVSLVDISELHKRAEFLIGVAPGSPSMIAVTATLMCFQFFFKAIKFEKLFSFVYPDNVRSIKSTLSLGFRQEAVLVGHIVDPKTGERHDLIQTGLLKCEAFNSRNLRLMKRLLS